LSIFVVRRLFIQPLSNAVQAMNEISNTGDLSQQLIVRGKTEFDEMAIAFNAFVGKIKQVIDLVIGSSENLVQESEKLSGLTGKSHTQTQIQKRQIAESVLSLNEMSSLLDGNAQHTRSAAESAQQVYSDAESSRQIVQSLLSSSRQAAEQVDSAVNEVNALEGLSDDIGDILSVIKGITEQTGLLSLNAAIEAARAGEAGRGFAVVADEVRGMSNKVQEQTEHIKAQIEKLQSAVKWVVTAMSVVREKSHDSVAHANTAGEALDSITRSTASIMELNQQIARDTELENESAIKVSANLEGIGLIAQETADASKAASDLGREFTFLSRQLAQLINQILLNKHDASSQSPAQRQVELDSNDDVTLF
jgi:methyl-accepting chemotaxis protein